MTDDEGIVFSLSEFELEASLNDTVSKLLDGLAAGCGLIKLLPETEPEFLCAGGAVQAFIDRLRVHPEIEELRAKSVALHELRLTEADPEEHEHLYTTVYTGPLFPPDGTEGERKTINVAVCYCTAIVVVVK